MKDYIKLAVDFLTLALLIYVGSMNIQIVESVIIGAFIGCSAFMYAHKKMKVRDK